MARYQEIKEVVLGSKIELDQFMAVVRGGAKIEFSPSYLDQVNRSRKLLEKAIADHEVMHGVTTGFGALSTKAINREETRKLQENIVLTHAVSVGQPFTREQARGTMLMILQNIGQGYSGVRLKVLEAIKEMLNQDIVPWIPKEGSVGYLAPEAHLAMVLMGRGKAWYKGELIPGVGALEKIGIAPLVLGAKEGLALISGTTSVTALGSIALYDILQAAKSADVIAGLSLEALRGVMRAFDARVMSVRPHEEQRNTAETVRRILADSQVLQHYEGVRLQDALSLRCIPQLHGAAKKTLYDAKKNNRN